MRGEFLILSLGIDMRELGQFPAETCSSGLHRYGKRMSYVGVSAMMICLCRLPLFQLPHEFFCLVEDVLHFVCQFLSQLRNSPWFFWGVSGRRLFCPVFLPVSRAGQIRFRGCATGGMIVLPHG